MLKKFCFLEWHKEQEREHRERRKNNPNIRVQYIWEKPEFHLWYYLRHPHDYLLWLSFGNRERKHWVKINRGMKRAEKERAKRRRSGTGTTVIVNIPHASLDIPEGVNLYPDGEELRDISKRMSDLYTDELMPPAPGIEIVKAPICRIIVDTERNEDDEKEPTSKFGHGVIHTKDYLGRALRPEPSEEERQQLLSAYYSPHHSRLFKLCIDSLRAYEKIIILDLHSYSASYNTINGKVVETPDICIGYESPHYTDKSLNKITEIIKAHGFTNGLNEPFSGALVPTDVSSFDCVQSYRIKIKRSIYMDETTLERNSSGMQKVQNMLLDIIDALKKAAI